MVFFSKRIITLFNKNIYSINNFMYRCIHICFARKSIDVMRVTSSTFILLPPTSHRVKNAGA